jgi:hypothetical protein
MIRSPEVPGLPMPLLQQAIGAESDPKRGVQGRHGRSASTAAASNRASMVNEILHHDMWYRTNHKHACRRDSSVIRSGSVHAMESRPCDPVRQQRKSLIYRSLTIPIKAI